MTNKYLIILVYLIIIIMIPFFLDYLFKITTRKKKNDKILKLGHELSKSSGKPLIIFYGNDTGKILDSEETFDGDISEIIHQMTDNSCVIICIESLEYVNDVNQTLEDLRRVSGGDLFLVSVEEKSPRAFWDYQIKNIFEKPYYLTTDRNIKWDIPNDLQLKCQNIYKYIFYVLPYSTISNIVKKND